MKQILTEQKWAPLFVALSLLFFTGVVAADPYIGGAPPATVKIGTVSGGLYVDASLDSFGTQDVVKTFALIPRVGNDIAWARLYVSVYCGHMQNNYEGTATISFDGNGDGTYETTLGTENLNFAYVYEFDGGTTPVVVNDHCNRVTSDYLMWYDVTSLITSQNPKAHIVTTDVTPSFDGRIKMITLVIAYNDGDSDEVHYWVNQGHDVDSYLSDENIGDYIGETSFDLTGITGTVESSTLTVNHLASTDGTYTFRGSGIPSDPATGNFQGTYFGYNIWNVTSDIQLGTSNKLTYDRTDTFYKIPLATLAVKVATAPTCDLTITLVNPDTGNVFAKESNRVRVNVKNNGPQASPSTEIRLTSNEGVDVRESVPSIEPGATTPIYTIDPTIRSAEGGSVTYTAVIDPDNVVPETNEANNEKESTAKTVKFNGYKGKRYWDNSDITTKRTFDLRGGILYSPGNSTYKPGGVSDGSWNEYTVGWTSGDVPLPSGATIREARLYVPYTWDNSNQVPDHFSLTFNGNMLPITTLYKDESNFGGYDNYFYGLLGYNVTPYFSTGGNSAIIHKDDQGSNLAVYGLTLVVVYERGADTRKQIFLNEEFDILGADESGYATTAEEATAYVLFSGLAITPDDVTHAYLTTFVPSGNGPEGNLLFNGAVLGTNVWDYGSSSGTQVAVDSRDVKAALQATGNEAGIRSTAGLTPVMAASQAFLVLEYTDAKPAADFAVNTTSGDSPLIVQFTDTSAGSITGWSWDFNNDGTVDSTDQNPIHTYTNTGTYSVKLTVTGPGGSDEELKTDYITVSEATPAPVAEFSGTPVSGPAPLSVTFTDQSTNSPTSWKWEYGTGSGSWTVFSTAQNPTYSFPEGTYDIQLTATNNGGSNTTTKYGYITAGIPTIEVSIGPSAITFGTMSPATPSTGSAVVTVSTSGGTSWSVTAADADAATKGYMATTSDARLAAPFQLSNGGGFLNITSDFTGFMTGSGAGTTTRNANVKQIIVPSDAPGDYAITITFTGVFI
jgi:PKD repeat protein